MKNLIALVCTSLCITIGIYVVFAIAQTPPCCINVPLRDASVARFPQNSTVTVLIDATSGLTAEEMQAITEGVEGQRR